MAFSDPQSVDIGAGAVSLPRTGSGIGTGSFTSADGTLSMLVRNSYGKTYRRNVSIIIKKYASDPTNPALNKPVQATVNITVDQPIQGFTAAELKTAVTGIFANLTASTNANLIKLLGGEN